MNHTKKFLHYNCQDFSIQNTYYCWTLEGARSLSCREQEVERQSWRRVAKPGRGALSGMNELSRTRLCSAFSDPGSSLNPKTFAKCLLNSTTDTLMLTIMPLMWSGGSSQSFQLLSNFPKHMKAFLYPLFTYS